ncbi:MAG TPA: hypothetical protein VGL42_13650 [Opitutaceae bacterium]|jgi:hypothetical protein
MDPFFVRARIKFFRGRIPSMPIGDGYAPYLRSVAMPEDVPVRVLGLPKNGTFDASHDVELELTAHPEIDCSALEHSEPFELVMGVKVVGQGVVSSDIFSRPLTA